MAEFDRFDICEVYNVYAMYYNDGGYATGRREHYRGETDSDIGVRLSRMNFRPRPDLDDDTLTDNGREIYNALVARKENLCRRWLCVWHPGEPQPNTPHSYRYSGAVPNTGPRVCVLCGEKEDDGKN